MDLTPLPLLELDDLLSPGPTARENAEAAVRLGVKPKRDSPDLPDLPDVGEAAGTAVRTFVQGVNDIAKEAREAAKLPSKRVDNVLGRKTLGKPTLAQLLRAAAQSVDNPAGIPSPARGRDRGKASAVLSSQPQGRRTPLQINSNGKVTIPATRKAARRLAALRERKARIAAPLPGLDAQQTQVVRTVLREGDRRGATRKEKLAAVETALVESNARNLAYGDLDSLGWRQERTSIYGNGPTGPRNVRAAAGRFFEESVSDTGGSRGAGMTAGELAQTIQGSAFPERYDEVRPQALPILRAYQQGGKPSPELAAKLSAAVKQAQRLGIPTKARPGSASPTHNSPIDIPRSAAKHFVKVDGSEHLKFVPLLARQLIKLAEASGEPIQVNSGFRTRAEQEASYQDYLNGGNLAAVPGTSHHEFGLAADLELSDRQRSLLPRFGLGLPVPGEDWHVEIVDPALRTKAGYDNPGSVSTSSYGGLSGASPVGGTGTGGVVAGSPTGLGGGGAKKQSRPAIAGVTPITSPTEASAPLPQLFELFQLGAEGEEEPSSALGVIESLLRRRRL